MSVSYEVMGKLMLELLGLVGSISIALVLPDGSKLKVSIEKVS